MTRLPPGGRLRSIPRSHREVEVSEASGGVMAEWPVHDGDLVDAANPLARLYPEVSE